MTEQARVPMREKLKKAKDVVFHPERVRQEALGALYSSAVTRLRTDSPQFISAREGWGVPQVRVDYTTQSGHNIIIATSDVSENGKLPETPSSVAIAGTAVSPSHKSSFWITRDAQGKHGIELRAWDGAKVDRFKFNAQVRTALTEVLDSKIPQATRTPREPYGTQE